MRLPIPAVFLLALAPACATQGPRDTWRLEIRDSIDPVWSATKSALMRLEPLNYYITAEGGVWKVVAGLENSQVTITVEAHDARQSVVVISATKGGAGDPETATRIKDRILSDLERKR